MKLHIFKTGKHTDAKGSVFEFSDAQLQGLADNYNKELHQAPLVVGHPKDNHPAYGWVTGLEFSDGNLYAAIDELDTEFKEIIKQGRYKKVSASFYLPNSAHNPKPGDYYLRHIGFLGAMPPAIKGLKEPVFNDCLDEIATFDFHEPKKETNLTDKLQNALNAKDDEIKALKEQLNQINTQKREAENLSFCDSLIASGQLLPAQKETVLKLLGAQFNADFSESFENDFKNFLLGLPKVIDFNETATKEKATETDEEIIEYAEGTNPMSIEADQKIRALMHKENLDYIQAFKKIYN